MVGPADEGHELGQISLILRGRCVITFREEKGEVFEPIREQIRGDKGRIRKLSADYLVYALIDSIVDGYYPYLESMSDALDDIQERVLKSQDIETLQEIHTRRRELIRIRKGV